ncbi:hypothetical protein BDA99DRAFT_531213 [Phascolomyces articulosus]|uniref:Uncharacterized protein n=1 Tax=Phascolomyces articulosus TaxID=60185 RepID=A0AAD5PMA4_9FUNG|nr:hypothetical protein BDA99DRAFT_531213 [Phascolomyces articulosus]
MYNTGDLNWEDYFNKEELEELKNSRSTLGMATSHIGTNFQIFYSWLQHTHPKKKKVIHCITFGFPSIPYSFHNSDIQALGKKKTSTSHAQLLNSKRKLSSSLEIEREKIGKNKSIGGDKEFGGLEIGQTRDNTKEFEDSMLKLPFVLKDMLIDTINDRPSLFARYTFFRIQ